MNPLGVLRARDLMRASRGAHEVTIEADALIRDGMERMIGAPGPIGVVENGAVIGQLSTDDLLRGLSNPSGA